ncbi:MAG TPA: hypothetical protein VK465_10590, partial [Fibrobacteria bacterium]|nr:hypothetical protein [Fibrobacteria bacterium]
EVAKLGGTMLPDALLELNERLKAARRQLYQGEWHAVPKSLQASTREVEARLVDVPGGKKWAVEGMHFPPNGREAFINRDGWPDLGDVTIERYVNASDPKKIEYIVIPCFSGPMRAVHIPPGTKIYRVVTGTGKAEGNWWVYSMPGSGREWREGLAVLDSWNKDGYFVELTVPEGGLFAWEGKAASQIENAEDAANTMGQYLPGGQIQLFIDMKFRENAKAMEALSHKLEKPLEKILEKRPTPWTDIYTALHVPPKKAEAAILGPFEIESKKRLPAALVEKGTRRSRNEE